MRLELHPIARIYHEAEILYRELERELTSLEKRLKDVEKQLSKVKRQLFNKYGVGYLIAKSVRNPKGKKYRYLVWRTPDKDVYLDRSTAKRVEEIRESASQLRAAVRYYRKALTRLRFAMMASKTYRGTCIDRDSGRYVDCPEEKILELLAGEGTTPL